MATLLSNWTTIFAGNHIVTAAGFGTILPKFNTSGRVQTRDAFLIYSVKSLFGHAEVELNNFEIGRITTAPEDHFVTQLIIFKGELLSAADGKVNELRFKDPTGDFEMHGMVCFFHKEAGLF